MAKGEARLPKTIVQQSYNQMRALLQQMHASGKGQQGGLRASISAAVDPSDRQQMGKGATRGRCTHVVHPAEARFCHACGAPLTVCGEQKRPRQQQSEASSSGGTVTQPPDMQRNTWQQHTAPQAAEDTDSADTLLLGAQAAAPRGSQPTLCWTARKHLRPVA